MGTGKSSVGRILAKILGLPFVDLDTLIKERSGRQVADIFAQDGESAFRTLESDLLAEVARSSRSVVACGGGVVTSPLAMAVLADFDVVWLVSPMSALIRRTSGNKSGRPLLAGEDPGETLKKIVTSREPLYRAAADIALDTSRTTQRQSAQEIADILRGRRSKRLISRAGPSTEISSRSDSRGGEGAGGSRSSALRSQKRALRVELPRPSTQAYRVHIQRGLISSVGPLLNALTDGRAFVIADGGIAETHGEAVIGSIRAAGIDVSVYHLPQGEGSKEWGATLRCHEWLLSEGAERRDCIVGVGGGVTGDLAGFVASTYQRGMDIVHVPTTLLSQVDSAIGGKTGVNLGTYKNMVGSFKQPAAVLIDPEVLSTLPPTELLCGVAEIIKAALLDGTDLYTLVNDRIEDLVALDPVVLDRAIYLACAFKARIVGADEKEAGLRAILNYGHTMAHSIEATSALSWRHGHAVAVGMVFAARMAEHLGVAPAGLSAGHMALIARSGLPVHLPDVDADAILRAMRSDKKREGGRTRFVLLRKIGDPMISEVSEDAVDTVMRSASRERSE